MVGVGAWAIGGDRNATGHMGAADDGDSIAAIHRALELGVTWIDTAPGNEATGRSTQLRPVSDGCLGRQHAQIASPKVQILS